MTTRTIEEIARGEPFDEKATRRAAPCPSCGERRPIDPKLGTCGPCFYEAHDPASQQPDLPPRAMCNDCAFRPSSNEAKNGVVESMILGGGIDSPFYCHKPWIAPASRAWGIEGGRIVLLDDGEWRLCGGWLQTVAARDLGQQPNLRVIAACARAQRDASEASS